VRKMVVWDSLLVSRVHFGVAREDAFDLKVLRWVVVLVVRVYDLKRLRDSNSATTC